MSKTAAAAVDVRVVETRDVEPPQTREGVTVPVFDPEVAAADIAGADVAFVNGSVLVYAWTERYLAATRAARVPSAAGLTPSSLRSRPR